MRLHTATLLLRLGAGAPAFRRALDTVLRGATAGRPAGLRAARRALGSSGPLTVWLAWLDRSVSGPPPERWASPLVTQLLGGDGATPPPAPVVDQAWKDWLDHHHPTLWSLLETWGLAATGSDPGDSELVSLSRFALGEEGADPQPRPLARAAARFDHPLGERARARLLALNDPATVDLFCAAAVAFVADPEAAAFCVTHGLAPSDDVQRALFFVRTGQHGQYRALDPDGALLALGYRAASAMERSALRERMAALGDLDALRVLAGRRSGAGAAGDAGDGDGDGDVSSLTEAERAYVVRQLVDRGDRERLWRITPLLPLAEAVETVRSFGDWRPSGEDDRRLFARLRACATSSPGTSRSRRRR
ncbi:hypothetical protein [Streptomyces sp. 6N223]|uniref:hypothetical protein n=1 Tax=Streptomyces sp. 6N223 TaxID=3457412 RepID=UPI003FD41AD1